MASIAFHDPRLSSTSGGGETVTFQLMALLLNAGHTVTIITRRGRRSPLFEQFIARWPRLRCYEIEMPIRGINELSDEDAVARQIWNCDRLAPESLLFNLATRAFYGSNHFDRLVLSFIPDLALLAATDPILLNVFGLPPSREIAALENPLLDRCSKFVFSSNFIKREFRRLFDRGASSFEGPVIHASVQSIFYVRAESADKRFDVCFVGRLVRRKGVAILIEAISWLRCHRGMKVTLAVAGDGIERESLARLAARLDVAQQIAWLGALASEDVAQLLGRSRTFVCATTEAEAFCCSNLEAMARGVPVITTNLGGTADYVRPGFNALVCKPGCAEGLAIAIARLLDDQALSVRLKENGVLTARDFRPAEQARLWLDALVVD